LPSLASPAQSLVVLNETAGWTTGDEDGALTSRLRGSAADLQGEPQSLLAPHTQVQSQSKCLSVITISSLIGTSSCLPWSACGQGKLPAAVSQLPLGSHPPLAYLPKWGSRSRPTNWVRVAQFSVAHAENLLLSCLPLLGSYYFGRGGKKGGQLPYFHSYPLRKSLATSLTLPLNKENNGGFDVIKSTGLHNPLSEGR
jgi:hypothetical protein